MDGEERAIYWSLTVIGAVASCCEIASSDIVGTRATLALLMFVVGAVALLRARLWPAVGSARIQR